MTTNPGEGKAAWRRFTGEAFRLLPRTPRGPADRALAERVREYVFESGARLLLGFAPLPDEPDISGFFRRWVAEGGRLALPVWLGGDAMRFRLVSDWAGQLRPGRAGIMEPADSLPEVAPDRVDLALVPGRAFSEGRDRLGRGAGCYDALFRGHAMAKVGVAYDFQVFPEIPHGPGDVPMDLIITPTRIVGREAV